MGAKRFDCLGDWSRWGAMIPLRCRKCGHEGEVDPSPLMMRWGYGRSLEGLPFRCDQCKASGRDIMVGRAARLWRLSER